MINKSSIKNIFLILLSISLCECNWNGFYKKGRLADLNYPIETNLKTKIIRRYIDTLINKKGYKVPEKWQYLRKLVDVDSINNVRIYFKDKPEEMYLISYSGMLTLSDVYNPSIVKYDWVANRELLPKREYDRIQLRIKILIQKINSLAYRDSLIK